MPRPLEIAGYALLVVLLAVAWHFVKPHQPWLASFTWALFIVAGAVIGMALRRRRQRKSLTPAS